MTSNSTKMKGDQMAGRKKTRSSKKVKTLTPKKTRSVRGGATDKVTFNPFSITRKIDKSSPNF
jgi:type VI protein secretion system component Hcp